MTDGDKLRVLFCIGVTPEFFTGSGQDRKDAFEAITKGFSDLRGRFGVEVLGTIDDDQLMVGASLDWPWTCYILADVPDIETVAAVCNILRETEVGDGGDMLWRYLKIEARVGRPLFFGNE
jgi:hypothetical protein